MIAMRPGEELFCNPNVACQRLGDELVVVNLETDVIYTLNPTAAIVWEMVQSGSDIEDVRTRLLTDYDVEKDEIDRELRLALANMRDFGLLIPGVSAI